MDAANGSHARFNGNGESRSLFGTIKHDFLPSVAVFLVALPLCMGIAIASGAPVAAGLITGIVGGLVVGFLSGAPLQVSGPAAGLTVIVYGIVQSFGLEALGVIVLGAGLLQVVAGMLRLGQWFRAVSPAVIKGMLAGIGLLILASQFHVMIDDKPKESGIENLLTIPQAVAKGIGMPEASTAEQRAFRTQLLKDAGKIHERQTEVEDAVVAAVPQAEAKTDAEHITHTTRSTAARQTTPVDLSALAERQQEVNTVLAGLVSRIEEMGATAGQKARAQKAALAAAKANEYALAQMKAGDGIAAVEAQGVAVARLQNLLVQLKDHQWAAKAGIVTIVVLLLWNGLARGRLRMIPAPLVAVTVVAAAAFYWKLPVLYVEVPDNLLNSVRLPSLSIFESANIMSMIQAAVVVALIASAETLLCAAAVDRMHGGKRTNYDRELLAQGVGNSVCGLLGGLPMTGVIVRSAANLQAGASSRASAIMHGLWLVVFVSLLGFVLRAIPIASLAAVLVYTGYKLINLKQIKELLQYGWGEVVVFLATMIGIVVTDLLTGVVIGFLLSAAKLLYNFSHLSVDFDVDHDQRRCVLSLEGTATFLRLPVLANALEQVPQGYELHVELNRLDYIDHACLDLLMSCAKQYETNGGRLVMDWNCLQAQFGRKVAPLEAQKSVA